MATESTAINTDAASLRSVSVIETHPMRELPVSLSLGAVDHGRWLVAKERHC
jgi:hypothetical protein